MVDASTSPKKEHQGVNFSQKILSYGSLDFVALVKVPRFLRVPVCFFSSFVFVRFLLVTLCLFLRANVSLKTCVCVCVFF